MFSCWLSKSLPSDEKKQVAQLSQRNRVAGWVSYGRGLFDCVQIWYIDTLQIFKVKGQRSRPSNVLGANTLYTAMIGSATSKLAGHRNESGKGLAWLGRPQVAMHSQLPRFLVLILYDVCVMLCYVKYTTAYCSWVPWTAIRGIEWISMMCKLWSAQFWGSADWQRIIFLQEVRLVLREAD